MITDFVDGCGFIDARGTASVTRYCPHGIDQICSGPAKGNRLRMLSPLTVTCISSDGVGRSAKIEIVEAAPTMQ
jgi:hypothetical protein